MNGTDHVHIQYDELKKVSELDLSKASEKDLQLLMDIDERTEQCPVCRERYEFFMDSAKIVGWGRSPEMPLTARIMYEVESNLENLRGAARARLGEWLNNIDAGFMTLTSPRLKPAFGMGYRGACETAGSIKLESCGEGVYNFDVNKPMKLSFEIDKSELGTIPEYLIIIGRDGTEYFGVFDIDDLSQLSPTLTVGSIALEPGHYSLSIPE